MATLEQIQGKMKRLQAQAQALIAKQAQTVLADIRKLMDQHGLTTADIAAHTSTKKRPGRPAGAPSVKVTTNKAAATSTASSSPKGKLPPKYRDPKTGATWSGHARPPAWIAKVRDRTKFLIDGGGAAPGANGVGKTKVALKKTSATARTVAGKGQGKGSLPAKYRDPKTGATWSGHARAPAWIANVKDRTKFLIDGVGDAAATSVVTKKAAAKKAVARKAGTAKNAASARKRSVKKTAKEAPVSPVKRIVGKKTARPAVKKIAKSVVASRKAVATKKTVTASEATAAPVSATAPETVNATAIQ